jgi:hypothetical protein
MKEMRKIGLFFGFVIFSLSIQSQSNYTLSPDSEMKIFGTSTVSDWSVEVHELEGAFELKEDYNMQVGEVIFEDLAFHFPVEKMKSGRGPIMDGKVKKALKATEHPLVIYTATQNQITGIGEKNFDVTSSGILEVAGVKQEIEVFVHMTYSENMASFVGEGSTDLTMSMFSVEKPTAFFGELKTMDELNITFNLKFSK